MAEEAIKRDLILNRLVRENLMSASNMIKKMHLIPKNLRHQRDTILIHVAEVAEVAVVAIKREILKVITKLVRKSTTISLITRDDPKVKEKLMINPIIIDVPKVLKETLRMTRTVPLSVKSKIRTHGYTSSTTTSAQSTTVFK